MVCALDIKPYRDLISEKLVRMTHFGHWAASVNPHGSNYMCFTLWNISVDEIHVLYVNFGRVTADKIQTMTKPYLDEMGVYPVVLLKDGKGDVDGGVLPLLHLISQLMSLLCNVRVIRIHNDEPHLVFCGNTFATALEQCADLQSEIAKVKRQCKRIARGTAIQFSDVFCDENVNELKGAINDLVHDQRMLECTQRTVTAVAGIANLIDSRDENTTAEDKKQLLDHLKFVDSLFEHSATGYCEHKYARQAIFKTLSTYIKIFESHPYCTSDYFHFGFEHDIVRFKKDKRGNNHSLVNRIIHGKTNEQQTFRVSAGSSKKKVVYDRLQLTSQTIKSLNNILKDSKK